MSMQAYEFFLVYGLVSQSISRQPSSTSSSRKQHATVILNPSNLFPIKFRRDAHPSQALQSINHTPSIANNTLLSLP
jgi:hypothetical protein